MALSGRINGSVTNLATYFSFYAEWSATQSIANNCSYLTVSSYWATTNTLRTFDTTSKRPASISINGDATAISKRFDCNPWDDSGIYLIQTVESYQINHNADGTPPTVTIEARANGTASSYGPSNSTASSGDCVASGNIVLDTIPRYATVSQTLSSKTETTATIKWTADATVDYIWYSSNNGSSWTGIDVADGTTGTYTISGLTANTTYNIKTRVRRKDSQLTTDSSALSVKTYSYPYATSMPNFTIGDSLTLGFYNPLGREFTFYIVANGTQIANNWTISGTSYTGINASSSKTQLYATIPNAQSATYSVKCVYGSSTITKTGGTMSVNASECAPTIGSVTYQDTNSTVTGITGNNQQIVRNQSTVRYTASTLSATYSASLASCSVAVNGRSYTMTISGSSATGGNASIDSASSVSAVVTLTDSRGLTATKSVTVTMLDWVLPSAIISLARQSNYYSETNITVDASYSYVDGKNTISITYKARQQGTSSWTVTGTLSDNVQSTFTADNQYKWDVQVVLTDRFGGTTTYNLTLARGLPLIFFDRLRNSVSVEKFPDMDESFEVGGVISAKKTDSSSVSVTAENIDADVSLLVESEQAGVYSDRASHFLIYDGDDGFTRIPSLIKGRQSTSATAYTLSDNSGEVVYAWASSDMTITVPANLPIGWFCTICCGYYYPTLKASGSDKLNVSGATARLTSLKIPVHYAQIRLFRTGSTQIAVDVCTRDYYTAGDVLTVADCRFASGYVTSSSANLSFELLLSKPILGATGVTVNSMVGNCRCAQGGYLQYYNGSTYTNINTTGSPQWSTLCDSMDVSLGNGYVHVSMNCTAKFGRSSATVTNNSIVLCQFSTLSLTLT